MVTRVTIPQSSWQDDALALWTRRCDHMVIGQTYCQDAAILSCVQRRVKGHYRRRWCISAGPKSVTYASPSEAAADWVALTCTN